MPQQVRGGLEGLEGWYYKTIRPLITDRDTDTEPQIQWEATWKEQTRGPFSIIENNN